MGWEDEDGNVSCLPAVETGLVQKHALLVVWLSLHVYTLLLHCSNNNKKEKEILLQKTKKQKKQHNNQVLRTEHGNT